MTEDEIGEAFIIAAKIERRMPKVGERPSETGNAWPLDWVHSLEEVNGWGKVYGDKLFSGDDPLAEARMKFFDQEGDGATSEETSHWEKCLEWVIRYVDDEGERRALWRWAIAQAGGRPFTKWCFKVEGITDNTGRNRKNRAIAKIHAGLVRGGFQNSENARFGVLPYPPVLGDSEDTVGDAVAEKKARTYVWHDAAFQSIFNKKSEHDFSWAAARNRRRKAREKQRQKSTA